MAKKKNQDTSPLAMGRKQQGSLANKRQEKTGSKSVSQSSVSQKERQVQKSYSTTQQPVQKQRGSKPTTQQRQTQKSYGVSAPSASSAREKLEADRKRREEESKARRAAAQNQKSGLNSMGTADQQRSANRAVRNTPELMKKAVKDSLSGHAQTIADVTELTAERGSNAYAMKLGVDTKNKSSMAKVRADRKKTAEEARKERLELAEAQEKRQADWDKKTKGAKGAEKAYYGAVESGTGMLTDLVVGMGTQAGALAAMGSRTYGTTRGQAQKEGATEKEDRLYSLMQAGKEVGTELMFPGAGLAKKAYGKAGLPLAKIGANALTKRLRGKTADVVGAGLRLAGGVGEENIEEIAGWGLDPLIKEATYGKNVRERRKAELLQGVPDLANKEEASGAAAYLSSGFIEDTTKDLMDNGASAEEAQQMAEKLRDFYSAYYSGDEETMDTIAGELSGAEKPSVKNLNWAELGDTIASTTLLTGVTGLPGTVTTSARGSAIRDELGEDGLRALANYAADFEDKDASVMGEVARDRLNEGGELTSIQVYELAAAQMKQEAKDIERVNIATSAATKKMEQENLVEPYVVTNGGVPLMGEATGKAYTEESQKAENILKDKESITEQQIDDGSRAIAGFKTGVFTVNDANALNYSNTEIREAFTEATGVDLNQYVVKDKSGNVDIPATNTATKDALFAMASDNLVRSAEVETANWMDNVKGEVVTQVSSRMAGKGSLALQLALDDVDERNRSEYMMTANAADMMYQQGRNMGVAWDTISSEAKSMFPNIPETKLQMMYEAGLADRQIANDKAIGLQTTIGEKMSSKGERTVPGGKVLVDTTSEVKGTELRLFSEIANQLGADIHLVDEIVDNEGNVVERGNGMYDPKANAFYLNVSTGAETNIGYIFMHECTHYLKLNAPQQYQELENLVRERWFSANPEQMQNAIARKIEAYKAVGQNLTEEQALEEIIADAAHEFINDPNFANQVAEENPTLAKALLDSIRNALRMLRRILSSGSIEDETHMNSLFSQLDILDEAEKLWLNAYTQAVQNRADQAIDALQDAVNGNVALEATNNLDDDNIMSSKDIEATLKENFDEYKTDEENLGIATEALSDLQNSRLSISERNVQSRAARRSEQVRTIAKGITSDFVHEGYIEFRGREVKGPEDLAKLCQVLRDPRFETVRIVLTKKDKIVSFTSVTSSLPGISRAFKEESDSDAWDNLRDRIVRSGADGFYIVHNHPSGNVTASRADLVLTAQAINTLGSNMYKGHIILDHDKYGLIENIPSTYAPTGEMLPTPKEVEMVDQQTIDFIHEPEIDHPLLGEKVADSSEVAKAGHDVSTSNNYSVLLYLDAKLKVRGVQEVLNKTLKNDKGVEGFIRNQAVEFGSMIAALYTTDTEVFDKSLDLIRKQIFIDSVYAKPASAAGFEDSGRFTTNPDKVTYKELGLTTNDVFKRTHVYESAAGVEEYNARFSISEPRSASARYEQGYKLTQKQFRSFYSAHKLNLRGQEDLDKQIADIKENGFRSATALSNVMPVSTNDTIDPDNMNIMQGKYGVREGETVLLVPKPFVDKDDRIKDGFVPRDYEVVTAERDYQSYYELYSKAYDESLPRYSISDDYTIQNGKARWTDERIDRLIKEYGASNPDYSQAYAVMMAPKDFLDLTLSERMLNRWEENPNEEVYDLDESELAGNTQTPFLAISSSEGTRVDGHEGRHRMRALMRAGVESVPVVIRDTDTKYTKNHEGSMILKAQDFGEGPVNANAHVMVFDLVPIKESNRDELIQKFGGEADVRFSIPEYTQEEMDAHRQYLIDSSAESYEDPYTNDLNESGFIFPDGSLPRMGEYGARADDHNLVIGVYDDIGYDTSQHPKADAMARFLNEGNIRYMPENGSLELGTEIEPTYEQYERIRQMDYVNLIEFTAPDGSTADYKEYDGDRSGVVNDIKRFYRDGEIGGSELSQFRYSVTPEMDAEYMRAVDDGDIEEAQRLVDEAARAAGMRVAHRYHGTLNAGFTVFSKAKANVGGDSGAGFYFSTNEDDSEQHYSEEEGADNKAKIDSFADYLMEFEGEWNGVEIDSDETAHRVATEELAKNPGVYDVYLNYSRPYIRDNKKSTNIYDDILEDFDESLVDPEDFENEDDYEEARYIAMDEHLYEAIDNAVRSAYQSLEENYEDVIDAPYLSDLVSEITTKAPEGSLTWDDIRSAVYNTGEVYLQREGWYESEWGENELTRAIIEGFGYDAIEDKEVDSKFGQLSREMMTGTEHIIVFRPEQVKLADTVTYAEDGSIIPLSERFDPNNNDIRYSLPTTDSDGEVLSDGQMEFFKDSQARDEQGRLIPMYHVTRTAGFTIFDPTLGFDETSISFSNKLELALYYSSEDGNLEDWRTAQENRYGMEEVESDDEIIGHYKVYLNMKNPLVVTDDMFEERDIYEWPVYAKANGYDGVIHKDFEEEGWSIYQVFSSSQISDTRNLNPTDNPDVRFSITDDEDSKSRIAYEDAIDNSYEALERYERLIDTADPETYNFNKPFKEEDVAKFYAALKGEESVVYDDPVNEEDRVRIARSKEEFFNSLNAKWQDRWTTEGEVLDVKSVKTDIRNLVIGVMANSDTPAKYRNEIVKKTLFDVRTAYQLMKQDRTDIASYLLYHSAQRMIDNVEFYVDDTFDMYKDLKHYLRTTKISIGEEYWSDVDYDAFRKRNFGRLKLVKGTANVDQIYQELQGMYPEWFSEDETLSVPDQLLEIEHVLDSVQPYKEAYSSEAAAELAFDIADELYDIMAGGKEVRSLADTYKQRYDEKTKAMKQRHAEAMLRMRKARDIGIQAERAKWQAREERSKERTAHRKYFERINNTYDELKERLLSNTADKNIPEQYKKDLARLLAAFDLQTVGSKKREARTGHVAQKTIKMAAIRSALENIEKRSDLFHVNDAITDIIDELQSIDGQTVDALSASELQNIDQMLKALLHEFNNYQKVKIGAKKQQAQDLADAQVESALEHAKTFGPGNDYYGPKGWLDQIVNMDEMTPAYMFKRIDPDNVGLGLMWKEIRRSQDRYIRNNDQLTKWMEEIIGQYHNKGYGADTIEQWRSSNYARTFNFENGSVELTPAQMMSLYCLSKRNQAYGHMVGAGIVVSPVSFQAKIMSDLKKKTNRALPVILTDADIKQVVTALTPDQIQIANKLQELMATKMADWGNEASMNVLGIKLFNESDYFPIKSDKAALEKDLTNEQFENAIRNFGFTKAVQPGARNAIMIDDIFDVVTEHCNNMNLYNSYSETLNDFMKVWNKHSYQENGADYSVAQAISHAYSQKATNFIMTFIRDINGNVSRGRVTGIENAYNSMLANAKKAAVFANVRVLLQQPTAITRAFSVISPKYLKGVHVEKGAMQEMFEHCPIALWKSWGYYDINMGKSIEDVIMNEGKWLNDVATQAYGAADNITWTAIWQMVKAEMKDTHPDVKVGTDEYWELCNERMSEVVDLTQVVDSPLHRSHAMRSKDVLHKTATAFMAEPTLTFNMIRDGYERAREAWAKGDKSIAGRIASRTLAVVVLQAATVSAAAAIADALRGKGKDDSDEDDYLSLWWLNFVNNMKDELHIWNKVYYVKDVASLFEGWSNPSLYAQGWSNLATGFNQLNKKLFEGSKTPWWTIYYNLFGGAGYFMGVPVKTLMKDGRALLELFGVELPESLTGEKKSDAVVSKESSLRKLLPFKKSDSASSASATEVKTSDGKVVANAAAGEAEDPYKTLAELSEKAEEKAAGLTGDERNEVLWDVMSEGYTKQLDEADMDYIEHLELEFMNNGGDLEYFHEKLRQKLPAAYKKTIKDDMSQEDINAQWRMYMKMKQLGITDEEVSEICYKSNKAKDLKAAIRLNNQQYINTELQDLVQAGLTRQDFEKLYKYRNSGAKTYKGKYKDLMKSTGNFVWPTQGTITSHFGYRNAPTAGASSNHPAIDIGAAAGSEVVAADGGTVIYVGWNGGYGNSVGIKHDNGMVTYYNHLSGYNVHEGDVVSQGQQIAQVGSTGVSTGPHLDFKILDADGNPVDPEKYLS